MNITYKGNTVLIEIDENEQLPLITLPDGYSYERIHVTEAANIFTLYTMTNIANSVFTFPAVNSKSPCTISLSRFDTTKKTRLRFSIEKFGQIPDPHYFDNTFDPILVTGNDGNEYKVIPSDQFK